MLDDNEYIPPIIQSAKPLSTSTNDNSSDDEDGGVPGMTVLHVNNESDDDIEIDPYWAAIQIDMLQGLGRPEEVVDGSSSDSSMPDFKAISTIVTSNLMTLCNSDGELDEYNDEPPLCPPPVYAILQCSVHLHLMSTKCHMTLPAN